MRPVPSMMDWSMTMPGVSTLTLINLRLIMYVCPLKYVSRVSKRCCRIIMWINTQSKYNTDGRDVGIGKWY